MLPDFLGIGAPKSATTWLFHCLEEHPEVFVASSKEVTFFDYGSIEGRLAAYERHFESAGDAKAVGEFSTRYFASTRAPARVKHLIPDARLIVSLRNPVDQVYSHYWHLRRQNFHDTDTTGPPMSFEQALESIDDRLLLPGFYCRHLGRWLDHFDRTRIHVILFEDIVQDPARVISGLYSFLGVDSSFSPASLSDAAAPRRRGGEPRNPLAEQFHRWLYTLLTRRIYTPMKAALGVQRADSLKRALKAREILQASFFKPGYPPMHPDTRSRLADTFRSDIHQLERLLDRSLDGWCRHSSPDGATAVVPGESHPLS